MASSQTGSLIAKVKKVFILGDFLFCLLFLLARYALLCPLSMTAVNLSVMVRTQVFSNDRRNSCALCSRSLPKVESRSRLHVMTRVISFKLTLQHVCWDQCTDFFSSIERNNSCAESKRFIFTHYHSNLNVSF